MGSKKTGTPECPLSETQREILLQTKYDDLKKVFPEYSRRNLHSWQKELRAKQEVEEMSDDERLELLEEVQINRPVANAIRRLGLTDSEAIAALKSMRAQKPRSAIHLPISEKCFSYGYFSDPHVGNKKFSTDLFDYMIRFFKQEKPDFIVNPGDHLEGMSGRPGHVYELSHIGFQQQFDYAVELYRELDEFPHYGIDGNHDQWFYKKNDNGVIVGQELQGALKNYNHLGQDEADLIVSGIRIKLFHAGDGTAYATSYKLQKLIESFSGGEKPHIVHSGHYHKALYMFNRGVHGFECGTICGQTTWMRGKKIPAHMGFGLCRVYVNDMGIERLVHTWIPWYHE